MVGRVPITNRNAIATRNSVSSRNVASTRFDPNFLPSQLSNLGNWYRSDQGITIATGVSQWNDLSGNGRHLLQATSGAQPSFNTNQINGYATVRGDGTDDYLEAATSGISLPYTFFMPLRFITAAAGKATLGGGSTDSLTVLFFRYDLTAGSGGTIAIQTGGGTASASGINISNWYVVTCLVTSTTQTIKVNGLYRSFMSQAAAAPVGLRMFSGSPTGTRFGNLETPELIFYNRTLSNGEVALVEDYLQYRYALTF